MNPQLSLLELLADTAQCDYLSNLHYLSAEQSARLAMILEHIAPEDFSPWEWCDALDYFTGENPHTSCAEARTQLLTFLRNRAKK